MIAVTVSMNSCRETHGPPLVSLPDSIEVETVCALPGEFGDRYITGVTFDRMLTAKGPDVFAFVSQDGLHLAFEQHGASGSVVTVDGFRGKTYDIAAGGQGKFSLEGGHFAYFARSSTGGDLALVVDGREIDIDRDHDHEIASPLFLSADGSRWSYVGRSLRDGRLFVVTSVGRDRPYDEVAGPVLSWDGQQIIYLAVDAYRNVLVRNGHETIASMVASLPVFDLSGQHWAYVEGSGNQRVVLDGEAGDAYASIDDKSLCFSRDGRHFAYVATIPPLNALIVDGTEVASFDGTILPDTSLFSPDGEHTAYWVRSRRGGWTPVVDGNELSTIPRDQPGVILFSPTGDHVAYTESLGFHGLWRVVHDGRPGPEFDAILGTPRFSADGKRLAYAVRRGDHQSIVVDEVQGPEYLEVGDPVFSADGSHVAFRAMVATYDACVVIDGHQGPVFDLVIPNGPQYHRDGTLEYLAVGHSELVRVRHRLWSIRTDTN